MRWVSDTTENPFGDRSLMESVYLSLKQRAKAFFNNITSNPLLIRVRGPEVHLLLKPPHKTLHTILQPPREANLSCHVQH
jgi:hypothetical protein